MEPIRPLGPAESIPVYNCHVLVGPAPADASQVRARVANLEGIEVLAESERSALRQVVAAFKSQLTELAEKDQPIPWREPPLAIQPGEQARLIAVHL